MTIKSLENIIGNSKTNEFIAKTLRRIVHYREHCEFNITSVNIDKALPLSRFAVTYRFRFAENIIRQYIADGLCPFEPIILMEDETTRLVFPPIVELRGGIAYIMDGVHRFLAARSVGLENIACVTVEGDGLPNLPCVPGSWDELCIQDDKKSLEDILPGLDRALFRPLTILFNSVEFIFTTYENALNFAVDGDMSAT